MKNDMNNENIIKKKHSLKCIILSSLLFSLFIFYGIFNFVFGLFTLNFKMLFSGLFLTLVFYLILDFSITQYVNVLIYGREKINLLEENVKKERPLVSIVEKKDNDTRVEGIIGERERDIIDKDDDGHILVQEYYPLTENDVLYNVLKKDNSFSKTDFYNYVKNLFVLMQEAWSNNDYSKLRSFEADRLYYRHKKELERLIELDEKDVRDNITIKGVLLKDFRIENNKQILIVALTANMRRKYGFKVTQEDFPYILVFSRNVGVKTNEKVKLSVTNCCNCGAEINVSDDGICKYCDTSLVSGEHEWVLVDMKLINIDIVFGNKKRD